MMPLLRFMTDTTQFEHTVADDRSVVVDPLRRIAQVSLPEGRNRATILGAIEALSDGAELSSDTREQLSNIMQSNIQRAVSEGGAANISSFQPEIWVIAFVQRIDTVLTPSTEE